MWNVKSFHLSTVMCYLISLIFARILFREIDRAISFAIINFRDFTEKWKGIKFRENFTKFLIIIWKIRHLWSTIKWYLISLVLHVYRKRPGAMRVTCIRDSVCLRSPNHQRMNISNTRDSVSSDFQTPRNTTRSRVFLTIFKIEVFGNLMKHYLIYFLSQNKN